MRGNRHLDETEIESLLTPPEQPSLAPDPRRDLLMKLATASLGLGIFIAGLLMEIRVL